MNMENIKKDTQNSCICCGKHDVPEGSMVCADCEAKYSPRESLLDMLWKSIKQKNED